MSGLIEGFANSFDPVSAMDYLLGAQLHELQLQRLKGMVFRAYEKRGTFFVIG